MVVLGYQCSPQRSTGFTPYELMFARPPVVPPAVAEVCREPLKVDDPEAAAQDLLLRKQRLEQHCPVALGNLTAAQHRDQLRYLRVRAPDYKPRVHRFAPGDYVYVQQHGRQKLQPRAKGVILRVLEVRSTGVLVLQGRCGGTITMHMSNCAPCNLPDIDGSIDPLLLGDKHVVCKHCGEDQPKTELLLCDFCNAGHHTFCLQPPVEELPDGYWLCPECTSKGVTMQQVATREEERKQVQGRHKQPNLFPGKQMRQRDDYARSLDQRLVRRTFREARGPGVTLWGRLHFTEEIKRPWYFKVTWEDGDITEATTAGVKQYLQAEGTRLPARVKLPALPLEAAAAAELELQGVSRPAVLQVWQSRHGLPYQLPSLEVPAADMKVLKQCLKASLAQAMCAPITPAACWQQLSAGMGLPFAASVQHGGTVLGLATDAANFVQAWHAALKLRPALVLGYLPGMALPPGIMPAFVSLQQQQRALALRAWHGWWLLCCQPGMKVLQWLR